MAQQDRLAGINQAALNFVGLPPHVFEQFDAEAAEEARKSREELVIQLQTGTEAGREFYDRIRKAGLTPSTLDRTIHLPGNLSSFQIGVTNRAEMPDAIARSWDNLPADERDSRLEDPEIGGSANKFVLDLVTGFTLQAFSNKDWQTAINGFDVITGNGVLESVRLQELIKKLPLDRNNYEDRLAIAQAISNRLKAVEEGKIKEARLLEERQKREFKRIPSRVSTPGLFENEEARAQARIFVEKATEIPYVDLVIGMQEATGGIKSILVVINEDTKVDDPILMRADISTLAQETYPNYPSPEKYVDIITRQELQEHPITEEKTKLLWRRIEPLDTWDQKLIGDSAGHGEDR